MMKRQRFRFILNCNPAFFNKAVTAHCRMTPSTFSLAARIFVALGVLVEPSSTLPAGLGAVAGKTSAVKEPAPNTGTIEGVVRYRADPKRPWRFSRYYVKNAGAGALAEAVVALEGSTLAASAPPYAPQSRAMDQVNFQFVPETTAIRAGDSVHITNSDDALHNVMTMDGDKPFNRNVVKGKEFKQTFDRAGGLNEPIRLSCAFHGAMRAWIYVFDHPWFKVTERDGEFRFENVPTGEYTLEAIHPAGKMRRSLRVEVKPNGTTPVELILSPDDLIGSQEKAR
jgi:plastocyanin